MINMMNLRLQSDTRHGHSNAGFSLIEVLMAIFILGIGIISIAALLPAGIVQQQRTNDDIFGPTVANNALATIRARVRERDFGYDDVTGFNRWSGPDGDFWWIRPALVAADQDDAYPAGSIDIFNFAQTTLGLDSYNENGLGRSNWFSGIPVNPNYGDFNGDGEPDGPQAIISQAERVYPEGSADPDYAWDCMFRRQDGRIKVAIVVYRIQNPGGAPTPYVVSEPASLNDGPAIPVVLDLVTTTGAEPWRGLAWNAVDSNGVASRFIEGTEDGTPFDLGNVEDQWQIDGQQIIDQNGIVHRVLVGRDRESDGPVELARAVPELPAFSGVHVFDNPGGVADNWTLDTAASPPVYVPSGTGFFDNDLIDTGNVTNIWYVPGFDAAGRRLIPVYVLVQEL